MKSDAKTRYCNEGKRQVSPCPAARVASRDERQLTVFFLYILFLYIRRLMDFEGGILFFSLCFLLKRLSLFKEISCGETTSEDQRHPISLSVHTLFEKRRWAYLRVINLACLFSNSRAYKSLKLDSRVQSDCFVSQESRRQQHNITFSFNRTFASF